MLSGRSALAGFPARVAMRGRHVSEQTHALGRAMRAQIAGRERRLQLLRRRLDGCDIGRRLGAINTRLAAADGRLTSSIMRRHHRADAQLRGCAGRLDTLSPLAVLGRGYAVAWNADRTRVLREAATVKPGELVHVTLAKGELACDVRFAVQDSDLPPDTKQ
jgi:exodeoxyribonuclease VII large subunit